jgi:archaeal type IV pilus assembly protein PilA
MKTRKNILHSVFSSLKPKTEALTPIIGSLLLLTVTILLASIVAISVFTNYSQIDSHPLIAKISIESCKGGLYTNTSKIEPATLNNNTIILLHEGGDSLSLDTVAIKVSGHGNSYQGLVGQGGKRLEGDTEVFYKNLASGGKNSSYQKRNFAVLKNGLWDTGEKLLLCGQDSPAGNYDSSIKVTVNGNSNTSDNYGFKANSEITLRVIDTKSLTIIAEDKVVVKHVG